MAAVGAIAAAGFVFASGGSSNPAPLASPASIADFTPLAGARAGAYSVLARPRAAEDRLPDNVAAEGLIHARGTDSFRLAGSRGGAVFYVAPGADGASVCLLIADSAGGPADWIANCPPTAATDAGLQLLPLQRRPGEPAVFAGVVPDGIRTVVAGDVLAPVHDNVFSIASADGTEPSTLVFMADSGVKTEVATLGNGPLPATP